MCLTIGALLPSFTWTDPDEMQTVGWRIPQQPIANQDEFFIVLAVLSRRAEDFRSILWKREHQMRSGRKTGVAI